MYTGKRNKVSFVNENSLNFSFLIFHTNFNKKFDKNFDKSLIKTFINFSPFKKYVLLTKLYYISIKVLYYTILFFKNNSTKISRILCINQTFFKIYHEKLKNIPIKNEYQEQVSNNKLSYLLNIFKYKKSKSSNLSIMIKLVL